MQPKLAFAELVAVVAKAILFFLALVVCMALAIRYAERAPRRSALDEPGVSVESCDRSGCSCRPFKTPRGQGDLR